MANNEVSKIHKSLRLEVQSKVQRKNNSIRRNAECAAKKMYKLLRPTLVMHLVRGNHLYFKLDETQQLLCFVAEHDEFSISEPLPNAEPSFKMACPHRKKRSKLLKDDQALFDRFYIRKLATLFNLEALNHQEYNMLHM